MTFGARYSEGDCYDFGELDEMNDLHGEVPDHFHNNV